MGVKTTQSAEPDTVSQTPQPDTSTGLEPSPAELRDFLSERSDRSPDALEQQTQQIRDGIQFLDEVAAYYILGQQLDIDVAEAFETKQREYSLAVENLQLGMNKVDLTATVQRVTAVKEFERDDGSEGRVCNVILSDSTGKCVMTFWDDDIAITDDLSQGDTVRVENGYTKEAKDYPKSKFGTAVEVRIGDGQLLKKTGERWNVLES